MSRLEDVLDRIEARLDSLDKTSERNTAILEEHVRRTNILEGKISPLERDWAKTKTIIYVVGVVLGGSGLLGTFGSQVYKIFTGVP